MHVLVQYLPQCPLEQRAHAAQHFIDQRAGALPEAQRQLLRDEALALFDDPAMRALAPYPRQSEVALAGRIIIEGREIRLAGQIDALIDTPEALVVIDYKTGAVRDGSHVPHAYAAQLGLYRRLLMQLYPQREVRCYLVYTGGPHLVELSPAVMEKALSKIRA
jgi:ATP-dependent helicase/nuclease subunit A